MVLQISVEDKPPAADIASVEKGLQEYNREHVPDDHYQTL
jgi:hypothetical protein